MKWKKAVLGVGAIAFLGWGYLEACAPVKPGVVYALPSDTERASPKRLKGHVLHLTEKIGPRNHRHPGRFRQAADYIAGRFSAHGHQVERQKLSLGRPPFENVIVRVGPKKGPTLIIGAHYDSWMDTVGADDNASGVAGLLELSRTFAAQPPKIPVELVAYALEEPPHFREPEMGSAVHARSLKGREIMGMLALEMIGDFSDAPKSQRYPSNYLKARFPDVANFVVVIGRKEDRGLVDSMRDGMSISKKLPVYGYAAPVMVMGLDFSDHLNYWAAGYEAVMITDTAFFRNERYHTNEDVASTLDYERMALVVDGVAAAVRGFNGSRASNPAPPQP